MQVQSVHVDQRDLLIRYYWAESSSLRSHNFVLSVAWDEQTVSQISYMITTKLSGNSGLQYSAEKKWTNRSNKNISSSR